MSSLGGLVEPVTSAALFVALSGLLAPGEPVVSAALFVALTPFGAMTPAPVNTPGFTVAAIAGVPWFTDANRARLVLAACSCCVCRVVGA